MDEANALSGAIIAAAIEVHREIGPGLLESAYEECLCHEFTTRGIAFQRQVPLPVATSGSHWIAVMFKMLSLRIESFLS
jgi:GxxExxY protein